MHKKEIVYIISDINKSLQFEWLIEDWNHGKYGLSFILINCRDSALLNFIKKRDLSHHLVDWKSKMDIFQCIYRIFLILKRKKTDVVHCHLIKASISGLLAAWLAGIHGRVYTRHHGTLHHEYHPKGVWIDKLLNKLATDIIATSLNVRNILVKSEKTDQTKVHVIHHGFRLDMFRNVNQDTMANIRKKYNPGGKWPVIGVVSRLIHWKGVQFIVPAFEQLLVNYPNALLIIANARGPYEGVIEIQLSQLPDESFKKIEFEEDIFSLYQLFTIYVHAPTNSTVEAFGQTYVEALAAGIPSIFTLSGVAPEFIMDTINALLVDFKSSNQIHKGMISLLSDKNLQTKLSKNGMESVKDKFGIEAMLASINNLYDK